MSQMFVPCFQQTGDTNSDIAGHQIKVTSEVMLHGEIIEQVREIYISIRLLSCQR